MHDFSDVEILLFESGSEVRHLFRTALEKLGAETVHVCSGLGAALMVLNDTRPDLLILDLDMDDGSACESVASIRRARIGADPFVVIIGTTWHSIKSKVRGGLDCGVDDLVSKPVSVGDLADRISHLVEHRKPFVSADGYVGPDRRSDLRDDGVVGEVPLVTVPNNLRFRITGDATSAADPETLERARLAMELQRIRRTAVDITALAARMEALLSEGDPGTARSMLDRAGSLVGRIADWSTAQEQQGFQQIAASMEQACVALGAAGVPGGDQVELLGLHSQAMTAALTDPEETARSVGSALAEANSILGERGAGSRADGVGDPADPGQGHAPGHQLLTSAV